jgi:hypothetical protein
MEKHELSNIDFELIDEGLKALLNSSPDRVVAQKVMDLRDMFKNAYTAWLEVEEEAA